MILLNMLYVQEFMILKVVRQAEDHVFIKLV